MKNCRCCYSSYDKDKWCEITLLEVVDGEFQPVKPVGFCEFCDRNNKDWYIPDKKCHNENNNL